MSEKIIVINQLVKQYPIGETAVKVFDGFSLSVSKGERVALTGPSGSGKSTLLNIIGGLDLPDSGNINVNGKDLLKLDERGLSEFRNRDVGFVFQDHHLLPQCNVIENVLLPVFPSEKQDSPQPVYEYAMQLIDRVGLRNRMKHFPSKLSGGEKQRTAVVRALINQPSIILADEPTGSLDRKNAENLVRLLSELNKEFNITLIFATHSEHLAEMMDREVKLDA